MAALRAGTAMGSAAHAAYRLGQETSGKASVAAGMGGMANAASGAAMQGARSFASRVIAPFRESAERGRQAALNAGRTSPASSGTAASGTATSSAASDAAPAWARNLRSEQSARHRRHMAMQTIKDGDRPGSAANPDLSDKE